MERSDVIDFQPRVSIVIPVYNGSDYLREAVDSALAQSYENIEVIVVNDGSSDGGKTDEIALSYGNEIRYFLQENGGVASALNKGITEAEGAYISWLSHDDLYMPDKVRAQVEYLSGQEQKDIILYTDCFEVNDKSEDTGKWITKSIEQNKFRVALILGSPVNGCSTLIPKKCFDEIGLFDVALKTTQDYEMWFRMAEKYKFQYLSDCHTKSRIHENQGSLVIDTHGTEKNEYYFRRLNEITEQEIMEYQNEGSISKFYLECANFFKRKGYVKVSSYSIRLALKNMFRDNLPGMLKTASLSFYYKYLIFIKKVDYRWRSLQKTKA